MVRLRLLLVFVAVLAMAATAVAQESPSWSLSQNSPDPFCSDEGLGGTTILYSLASRARTTLAVWDVGMTFVVRTLIENELRDAGFHAVTWDGHDQDGVAALDGAYPYRLTLTDENGGVILFEDTKMAHVLCATPVEHATWSGIKALYE